MSIGDTMSDDNIVVEVSKSFLRVKNVILLRQDIKMIHLSNLHADMDMLNAEYCYDGLELVTVLMCS